MHNNIIPLSSEDYPLIIEVWEASVRATHHFLETEEIDFYKPFVLKYALPDNRLFGIKNRQSQLMAFMGLSEEKIEMLFVHPDFFGQNMGRELIEYAQKQFNIRKVDVNEENLSAKNFYEHMGFKVIDRSELDGNGKPHPILFMEL